MSGKSKKSLPCIAINYEEDKKNGVCPNPALNGPTVNGEKRICYCQYHWDNLLRKNSINVNYDVVKNFVKDKKVSKDKKKVVISEYNNIKSAIKKGGYEACFDDNNRVLGTSSQCTYKILCKDKKCEDPVYLGHGAASPRTPAVGAKTPAARRAAAASPGLHGPQISSPLGGPPASIPILPKVQGASSAGSAGSKKDKKNPKKDEEDKLSELDDELGSDDELEMSDSEGEKSGSDYSDSDEEASESDEDEVKTKLRVIGYGGKDKKIPNYKTIVKSKGVKSSNKRNIRGRYEIVRSDIAPYIRINTSIVEALEILDNTYDLMEALDKIGFIRDTIKNHPKNIEIAEKKKKDQSMWSVEDSVINYIAEKFAPYVNDSDRIELLLSYIFDYDRRDLTKNFKFYGFTTPKGLLDKTPYERLKFRREGTTPMEETVFPESYNTAFERQVLDMQFTPKDNKKPKSEIDSGTCGKNLGSTAKSISDITEALKKTECINMDIKTTTKDGKGFKLSELDNKFNNLLDDILKTKANKSTTDPFKLNYNKGVATPDLVKFGITSDEAKTFIETLYGILDTFYAKCKEAGVDNNTKITSDSWENFQKSLASNKGIINKLNDELFKQVFGVAVTATGGSVAAASSGSAPKAGSAGKFPVTEEMYNKAGLDSQILTALKSKMAQLLKLHFDNETQFNTFVSNIKRITTSQKQRLITAIGNINDTNIAAFKRWLNITTGATSQKEKSKGAEEADFDSTKIYK
jgi:hypothetical protein